METKIIVDNLKCGGCAATITKEIKQLNGIINVEVFPGEGLVKINHDEKADLDQIKTKLYQLGYPEAGTTEGFDKFTSNVKSYVSCAVGRFSKKDEDDKSQILK